MAPVNPLGEVKPIAAAEIEEARELLVAAVSIYSPSGGEGRIVEWVERWAAAEGIAARRVPAEIGRDCLVLGAAERPALAIVAHLDTVTPTWPGATEPRVEGNVVKGLGAVDDKGGVVACMLAAKRLAAAGTDLDAELPAVFAFAVDEETGGSGSRALAIDLAPRFAIALEGTGLRPGTVECGDLEALVHVHGVAAHGSLAELGENAAHAAAALVAALPSLGLDSFDHPLLGASRASVTEVHTGAGMNVVPDACTLRLRIRLVPGQDLAATIAAVEELAARFGADVQMVEGTVPFELPDESPLRGELDAAVAAVRGEKPEPLAVPAWTDAHNFVDFGGAEALVFGPGSIDTAHTPEEQIDVTEIAECARVFERLLGAESLAALAAAAPRPDRPRYGRPA